MAQVFMFDKTDIIIDLEIDLTSATGPKILYKKPDGITGEWVATKSGTTLIYSAVNGEIDQPGLWQFEGRVDISGKKSSAISTVWVDKPLDV